MVGPAHGCGDHISGPDPGGRNSDPWPDPLQQWIQLFWNDLSTTERSLEGLPR